MPKNTAVLLGLTPSPIKVANHLHRAAAVLRRKAKNIVIAFDATPIGQNNKTIFALAIRAAKPIPKGWGRGGGA